MRTPSAALLAGILFLTVACTGDEVPAADNGSTNADQLSDLENRLEALEQVISTSVDLIPGQDSYSVLKIDLGALPISLEEVRVAGDGSEIVLRIGNPTSAGIEDLDAKLYWGAMAADSTPIIDPVKSREIEISKVLAPGRWTTVTVSIPGVPPDAIGFVRLADASHRGIDLR
jgi:hypothetical protein